MDILNTGKNPGGSGRGRIRRAGRRVATAFLLALLTASQAQAQTSTPTEYQVKATWLLNFLQFTEWPAAAFTNANTPIRIGILGDDPFGGAGGILEKTVEGETINSRKLVVIRVRRVEDVKDCQLLFISKSEKPRLTEILRSLETASVLTVGETESFARSGGIINFYLDGKKVRFEINAAAARRKGIKISSQVLDLAKPVGPTVTKEN